MTFSRAVMATGRSLAGRIAPGATSGAQLQRARDRPRPGGRILVIDERVPQHDRSAGDLTLFHYLRLLVEQDLNVSYLPDDGRLTQPYSAGLQRLGVEVVGLQADLGRWLAVEGGRLDWVLLARPAVASRHIRAVRRHTKARLLYYTHDLHFLREQRRFEALGDPRHREASRRMRTMESAIFRAVDRVLTPSEEEAAVIRTLVPERAVTVLPPYVLRPDIDGHAPPGAGALPLPARRDILFVGGYAHTPNVDAARFLVDDVLPRVWEQLPDAHLWLLGSAPTREILALASERVTVPGFVPDLAPYYARARLTVSPLRYGAGVKGKIVESLMAGVPVVTTPIGAEGVGLTHGLDALVAPDAEGLARAVVRVRDDPALSSALATAGRALALERYGIGRARVALREALAPVR